VLGVDLWGGSAAQVLNFKNATGATYPILLDGSSATGGNVTTLYGQGGGLTYDNFVVVDMRDLTVAYHAMISWPHGNRYQLGEIRDAVDGIVNDVVAVGDDPGNTLREIRIQAFPNPFQGILRVELDNTSGRPEPGRVSVLDIRGREVATVFEGTVNAGRNRFNWSTNHQGERLAAGVYVLRASVGDRRIQKRVIYLP
jgi:hypothetical protein